jgi:2-oxoglutarate ferredoxin oxidoreductase subunit gamma
MRKDVNEFGRNEVLRVMACGHGGQGVLDLGNFIAYQALKEGDRVVYTPTYGPESRGGKVRCWVTTSKNEIDSPVSEILDILLILNKPSMEFVPQLRPGGLLLYNISIIDCETGRDDIVTVPVPSTALASQLAAELSFEGAKLVDPSKVINCVMYGGFLARTGWELQKALSQTEDTFKYLYRGSKAQFIPINIAGVKKGFEFIKNQIFDPLC